MSEKYINYDHQVTKLDKARWEFNKVFGKLKDLDLPDEYVKCKLKVSKLSSSQRSILLSYVEIRRMNDSEFNCVYNKLDELIYEKLLERK